jgi:IS4 transposase
MTVAVYFEENKPGELEKRILLSNLKKQSLEKMQQAYKHRWATEEYFKQLKDKYDLENFRVREFKAIERIVKLILITNAIFTDSLLSNSYWLKPINLIFKNLFNLKGEIKKKGIGLLREIATRIACFGLIDDFKLLLRQIQPIPT